MAADPHGGLTYKSFLGAAFFTKKAVSFRSFFQKAAPKTSVILKRIFETDS
jgi:hypothetical protein